MIAGYSPLISGFYLVIEDNETGAGLGNQGYRIAAHNKVSNQKLMVKRRPVQDNGWEDTWNEPDAKLDQIHFFKLKPRREQPCPS